MSIVLARGVPRVFVAILLCAIASGAKASSLPTVFVEAMPLSEGSGASYELVKGPFGRGARTAIVRSNSPIEILECSNKKITYLNAAGEIFEIELGVGVPRLIVKLVGAPNEEARGKYVSRADGSAFLVINSAPSYQRKEWGFGLIHIGQSGDVSTVFEGAGQVNSLVPIEADTLELVQASALLQYNIKTKETRRISPIHPDILQSVVYSRGGVSVLRRNEGATLDVRLNYFGASTLSFTPKDGSPLFADIRLAGKKLLAIVVGTRGDRLVEVSSPGGKAVNVYRSNATISSACYLAE
ncbi:hypothetical protein [Rhizobacter sp. SG703]|uniref:hypothetical protein n=1 Tax=Rhizobacter sp. SG703 TaxID=2587140 RepID=UPI001446DE44|nr:hypothetical protein [Rhizobacter sp. SG703]NKI94720.1 hypothetical protein [Rhizobacter sp. SG703]